MRRSVHKVLITALLICHSSTLAYAALAPEQAKVLANAYTEYKKGAYLNAVKLVDGIQTTDREGQGTIAYFKGINFSKLQDFPAAITAFAQAEKFGNTTDNLHYEYGQALYATQRFQEARDQFKKSIVQKYKIAASAYYVAFINQSLEEYDAAADFYKRIQKLQKDPEKVKQPALYQLAEILYSKNQNLKDKKAQLKDLAVVVLPAYEAAKNYESDTATYTQAQSRIQELEQKLSSTMPKMKNGIPIPRKPYVLRFSQDIEYDSNVVTRADEAILQVTGQDSMIVRPNFFAKYQMNVDGIYSVIPEISASYAYHLRRSVPDIFQNDNISVTPALRVKHEHLVKGSPATGLFDFEYNYMLRDYLKQHHMPFYSRYFNFVLGERAKLWATGSSTLKFNLKFFESQNPERTALIPGASFTQNIRIWRDRYDLSNTLSWEYTRARNDANDEKNYKIRSSVTFPNIAPKLDLSTSASLNMKDTMKQRGSRGTEFTFNPIFTLSKTFSEKQSYDLEYGFTKNWSKSKDSYQYTRNDIKLTGNYNF